MGNTAEPISTPMTKYTCRGTIKHVGIPAALETTRLHLGLDGDSLQFSTTLRAWKTLTDVLPCKICLPSPGTRRPHSAALRGCP